MKKKIIDIFKSLESPTSFFRGLPRCNYEKAAEKILEQFKKDSPLYWYGGKIKSWETEIDNTTWTHFPSEPE